METIRYPSLASPFTPGMNPHALAVEDGTYRWVERYGLLDRARSARLSRLLYGHLMARAYPLAPLPALQLIADWNTWLFLLDDQCDEAGLGRNPTQLAEVHAALLAIMRGVRPAASAPPEYQTLADLAQRLRSYAGDGWMQRFILQVSAYFTANVWEATNRAESRIPDVATYLTQRPYTGAVFCYIALIELAGLLHIRPAMHAHPDVQRLAHMTNNIICWSNDIISLDKELRHGDVHNLVVILHHERKLSLQEAVLQVAALHDTEVEMFASLANRLCASLAPEDADVARYIAGMQFWMRANLDWSAATSRYQPEYIESSPGQASLPASDTMLSVGI